MKKGILILIVLLLFPIISAVEFDMKDEFSQGETLMAKVSGNFLDPVLKENIFFYRGHVRIPITPEVAKIDDEFYIYAQLLDKEPNNYSIVIEGARYMKGSQVSDEDLVKNFSINNDTADFSIEPGFVITKDDFSIEVQNLQDSKITIQMNIKTISGDDDKGFLESLLEDGGGSSESSVTLKSGEIEKINFGLIDITQPTLKTIELSTGNLKYEVPVYIFLNETEAKEKERDFEFDLPELNVSMSTNSETTRIIYLFNTGDETLENITLSVSDTLKPFISLSIEEIDDLEENSSIKIELNFTSDYEENILEGQLKAKYTNESETFYTYSAIFLNFIRDYEPLDGEEEVIRSSKNCSEIKGVICSDDEECEGDTYNAKDAVCCLGTCKEVEKSSAGKIIGWIIVVVIVLFLIWFFKAKYRRARKNINLLNIAKGKK